jgi:hypothetical protein
MSPPRPRQRGSFRLEVEAVHDHVAAALLLALDDEVDVQRRPAVGVEHRFVRLEEREDLPLVVHRAAGVQVRAADRRLERRGDPLVERVGGLDVVVPVDQHVGPGTRALRPDDRVPSRRVTFAHLSRVNSTTSQSAARRQSPALAGRVLTLGMRRKLNSSPSRRSCSRVTNPVSMGRRPRKS